MGGLGLNFESWLGRGVNYDSDEVREDLEAETAQESTEEAYARRVKEIVDNQDMHKQEKQKALNRLKRDVQGEEIAKEERRSILNMIRSAFINL